jgi:phosphoribosylamine-glycine ligase
MKRKGRIVFKGGLFHCEDCGKKFTSLLKAEEHKHAKQKQKGPKNPGEGSYPTDQGDGMRNLLPARTE